MIPGSPPLLSAEGHEDGTHLSQRKPSFMGWFNKQTDRCAIGAVEKQSLPDVKIVHAKTKSRVRVATIAEIVLRSLSLVSSVALLVCAILIVHTSGLISYFLRAGPIVSIVHCCLALWVHIRQKHFRPSNCARYMVVAGIFDLVVDGFFGYSAYICFQEWTSSKHGWGSKLGNGQAKNTVVLIAFILNCVCGALHLFAVPFDIYLLVIYLKISKLPPNLNPLERETLTSRPRRKNRLSDWRIQHSKKLSDATLIGEPPSPTKTADISYPPSPTKNGLVMHHEAPPLMAPTPFVGTSSSRYSRPTVVPPNSSTEPCEVGYQTPHGQTVTGRSVNGHERTRSRPDTSCSDATVRYSGDEDEQPKTPYTHERNASRTTIHSVPSSHNDRDWYYQNPEPQINDNSGTVVHHDVGSKKYKSRNLYGSDHVYVYCGINEGIEEEDEEEEGEGALPGQPFNNHGSKTKFGLANAYSRIDADADDSDGYQDTIVRSVNEHDGFYDAEPAAVLSQSLLLNVPKTDEAAIHLPSPDEIDDTYNPLTGSVRGNTTFPFQATLPNQPRGLTPTSKDRFYSRLAAHSAAQPSGFEPIIQSPTEPTRPITPGTKLSEGLDEHEMQKKKSLWKLRKSKKSQYEALKSDDNGDQHESSSAAAPAPAASIRGDREGRVVSNSGAEWFAGENQPPSVVNSSGAGGMGSVRVVDPKVAGPKQRKVSGRNPTEEENSIVLTPNVLSPSPSGRVPREVPGSEQFRAPGWARFGGL